MNRKFSLSTAVKHSFDLIFNNASVVIPVTLLYWSILALVGFFSFSPLISFQSISSLWSGLNGATPQLQQQAITLFINENVSLFRYGFLALLLVALVSIWLWIGLVRVLFDLYDTGSSNVSQLFSGSLSQTFKMLAGCVLLMLMLIPAFMLFVVPGIYLLLRFMFFPCFIVDQDAGVIESFKKSWHITEGHEWAMVLLLLVFILCSSFISLRWVAYLLVTPFNLVLWVSVYRQLSKEGRLAVQTSQFD
jgi:hypothetical protein